jgi:hypothetical protein
MGSDGRCLREQLWGHDDETAQPGDEFPGCRWLQFIQAFCPKTSAFFGSPHFSKSQSNQR